MYLVMVIVPLLSAVIVGLFGRYLGSKGSSLLSVMLLFINFTVSIFIFYEVSLIGCNTYINLLTWIDSGVLHIDWGFLYDTLTSVMCCVITFISFLVHLYSTEYMAHDPHLPRFMSYLSLFTFFMIILVTADNFIQMFVGWEGVGLCSFLLINFWFTRIQANKAAIKAMVLNRIGDFGLLLGILIIFIKFKSLDYCTVFSLVPFFVDDEFILLGFSINVLNAIGLLLLIGATGKSAQIGLHVWLPDAMEGPTPVSALIHAATMVTAGVFLIARCSPIYEYTPEIRNIIIILGALTAFFSSTIGLVQNDLKKVIAYSTCSQLGYMVFVCGLSSYNVGIFHLVNHAFFKALLFLGAGSVIHAVSDEQDMRKMGGLKNLIPFTYSTMVIGSLALIGFPFLSGFYSKDIILELAFGKFTVQGHFSYILGTIGAFFTAYYSTRLMYLTFLSPPNGFKSVICNAYDSSYAIGISLLILSMFSIFSGFYLKDMFIGLGTDFWGNSIFVDFNNMSQIDSEFIEIKFKLIPVIFSLFGMFTAFLFFLAGSKFLFKIKVSYLGRKIFNFLNKKWFFDKIYNEGLGQTFFILGYNTSYKIIDRGIFEVFGPFGLSKLLTNYSLNFSSLKTGYIYHYLFSVLVSCTFLLIFRQLFLISLKLINIKIYIFIFIILLFFWFFYFDDCNKTSFLE